MTYANIIKVDVSNATLRRMEDQPKIGNQRILSDLAAKLIREALDARDEKKAAK